MSRVREKIADKKKRAKKITTRLRRMYGAAECALEHNSAWHLLISTILSAQSTDETVNRVTERLYKKYNKPADFLKVSEQELQDDIHATGFFRQKTKSIRGACSMLVEEFGGQVPTGAVGSLREEIEPGHLVICDQVIDKTFRRESTFFDEGLAVHVEMAEPFCRRLGEELLEASDATDVRVHKGGTYVCMEGPQFSTRAESLMHHGWGGDLIGMTCMPEAKLAREAEMCYALVALPTDYDCWRPHAEGADKNTLMKEIISNMNRASAAAGALIDAVIRHLGTRDGSDCSCRHALEFGIWSDKSSIDPAIREKHRPLIGRYLGDG